MWLLSNIVEEFSDLKERKTKHPKLKDVEQEVINDYLAAIECLPYVEWETCVTKLLGNKSFFKAMCGSISMVRGEVVIHEKAVAQECHMVSHSLATEFPDKYDYYIGLATTHYVDENCDWHVHSFLVEKDTGNIIEPTPIKRKFYVGRKLTPEEMANMRADAATETAAFIASMNFDLFEQSKLSIKHLDTGWEKGLKFKSAEIMEHHFPS